jgi:hypothetical protein
LRGRSVQLSAIAPGYLSFGTISGAIGCRRPVAPSQQAARSATECCVESRKSVIVDKCMQILLDLSLIGGLCGNLLVLHDPQAVIRKDGLFTAMKYSKILFSR